MLTVTNKHSADKQPMTRPVGRPGDRALMPQKGQFADVAEQSMSQNQSAMNTVNHSLANLSINELLYDYERSVKSSFDKIVPTLKMISAHQHEEDFAEQAQAIAQKQLGFSLPDHLLYTAWSKPLDMSGLYASAVFETYRRFAERVFVQQPLARPGQEESFQAFIEQCGFHIVDVSPCADGRLAHVISYVLRMPYKLVRRRSYAGAMFDIENTMAKWIKTEMLRFREGRPNSSDANTRYLKVAVYHFSSIDPEHNGCAAHGSNTQKAAQAGIERLTAFRHAIENTYCCGASVDCLLIGIDTDTDSIRIHCNDDQGEMSLDTYISSLEVYENTLRMNDIEASAWVKNHLSTKANNNFTTGMLQFVEHLLVNNLSQINYVKQYFNGAYPDHGHEERFIGTGVGFEEVQLRNLKFFSYLKTVEEATSDLDVGVQIFKGLTVSQGLAIPMIVRFDYHGNVPGAKQRAVQHCQRVSIALHERYKELSEQGFLHTLQVVRDLNKDSSIEVIASSIAESLEGVH